MKGARVTLIIAPAGTRGRRRSDRGWGPGTGEIIPAAEEALAPQSHPVSASHAGEPFVAPGGQASRLGIKIQLCCLLAV